MNGRGYLPRFPIARKRGIHGVYVYLYGVRSTYNITKVQGKPSQVGSVYRYKLYNYTIIQIYKLKEPSNSLVLGLCWVYSVMQSQIK